MNLLLEISFISIISSVVGVAILYRPDATTLFHWIIKGLLALGAAAFIAHYLERCLKKIKLTISNSAYNRQSRIIPEETQTKEKEQRRLKQNDYSHQAHEYEEKILKPREEAKHKDKEEDFYKFSGPAWKGHGEKLGGKHDVPKSSKIRNNLCGRDAADVRVLPESVVKKIPTQEEKPVSKKIELPDEPAEGEDVVTLAFRTGYKIHKRKFLMESKIQMEKMIKKDGPTATIIY